VAPVLSDRERDGQPRVLGLVPARGGSKGVPRKNVRPLLGRPLLAYTADAALAARSLERVVLSTEDEEIAAVGLACGLDVPFARPPALARDETPMLDVVRHAVLWLEERGDRYDAVCLLQPTSPLRTAETIDACVALLERAAADAVVTTLPVPAEHHPDWSYFADGDGHLKLASGADEPVARRQDLRPAVHREGSVYVCRRDVLIEGGGLYGKRLVGYPVDPTGSVNVDNLEDWERAERLLLAREGRCAVSRAS
jgi:CMP-N-acetylneuraminic acid synthetase